MIQLELYLGGMVGMQNNIFYGILLFLGAHFYAQDVKVPLLERPEKSEDVYEPARKRPRVEPESFAMLEKIDLEQRSQTLDVALLLDEGSDVKQAKENGQLGAIGVVIPRLIQQEVPFIFTANLVGSLKHYAQDSYNALLTNKWLILGIFGQNGYVICLPKNYWPSINLNDLDNLQYIGINKTVLEEKVQILNQQSLDALANMPTQRQENAPMSPLKMLYLKDIFAKNPYVRKNIYLDGHGDQNQIAGLELKYYQDLLKTFNDLSVNLVYVSSCYAGGANILKAYQEKVQDYTKPLNLNYFLMIGSISDAAVRSSAIDFRAFFDATHQFFSPKGPYLKKPLEAIGKASWGGLYQNLPTVRFPGNINYFKVLDVDDKVEIITYAKARAAELEQPIAAQRHLVSAKKGITIPKNKRMVLIYPPVIKAPIYTEPGSHLTFVSMIPGNSVQYMQELNIDYDPSLFYTAFHDLFYFDFKGRKVFFIKHMISHAQTCEII